jgi:hypothetical protein
MDEKARVRARQAKTTCRPRGRACWATAGQEALAAQPARAYELAMGKYAIATQLYLDRVTILI